MPRDLYRFGYVLVMADWRDRAVGDLRDHRIAAIGIPCDVRNLDSMTALRDEVLDRFGEVSVVCLN
ncbi:MAG: short-chain dehydrogenase, partial [Actinobacteria bacterium]